MQSTIQLVLVTVSLLCGCLFQQSAFAATDRTLTAEWQYSKADETLITGYRFYDESKKMVKEVTGPALRETTWVTVYEPGTCHSFYMVAVGKDTRESANSNVYNVCDPVKELTVPASVTIKFQ